MWMPLIFAGLAVVMVLSAALVWRHATQGKRQASTTAVLERRLKRGTDGQAQSNAGETGATAVRSGLLWWDRLLVRAGVRQSVALYVRIFVPALALALLTGVLAGALAAWVTLAMLSIAWYFGLWLRADRRQRRLLAQLPTFLDSMVRLITIGNSMGAAFQTAAQGTDEPLREVVEKASALSRSKDLDVALAQVARQFDLKELQLLSAVIGLALRFGGRSDQVLERMAALMRDVSQARSELVATSAEIRLSAWILVLLPLGIAGFIVIANNALFMGLWRDPAGFKMLMSAMGLQLLGSYFLYRMARSI